MKDYKHEDSFLNLKAILMNLTIFSLRLIPILYYRVLL